MKLQALSANLLNLLYPAHCHACEAALKASSDSPLCPACRDKLRVNPRPHCAICGKSMANGLILCADCRKIKPSFSMARSVFVYDGPIVELIHTFKYKGRISLAKPLADWMTSAMAPGDPVLKGVDVISYVPTRDSILNRRDYNHSRVLANMAGARLGIRSMTTLRKRRSTKPQNALARQERLSNLKGAFRMSRKASVFGMTVLLIDDVMTTGATLNECARVLMDNGAVEVKCLTLSRGA